MYSQIASNKRRSIGLLLGFVLFISGLAYILTLAFNESRFFIPVVIFAVVYAMITYFASAQIAITMSGAREIQKKDAPDLYNVVENLAITAGIPTPKVYIIEDDSPNAFATGRDPQHAIVAVTSGILRILDRSELEGVIAHELSHVGNYDIRFMAIVVALVSVVAVLSDMFLRLSFWSSFGDEEDSGSSPLLLVIGIAGAILAPIAAAMTQMAISRKREFLADASGALLTRYPEGLARALAKIEADPRGLARVNTATAPLYISNPLKGQGKGIGQSLANLFSTHPPTAERIKRLNEMESKV
jgi:heat shock protein HtpX